jgi:hypothetical protein
MNNDNIYDDLSIQMHTKIKEYNEKIKNEELKKQKAFEKMCDLAYNNMMDVLKKPEFLDGNNHKPFNGIFNDFYEFKKCTSFIDFNTSMKNRGIKITETNDINYTKMDHIAIKFKPDSSSIEFRRLGY